MHCISASAVSAFWHRNRRIAPSIAIALSTMRRTDVFVSRSSHDRGHKTVTAGYFDRAVDRRFDRWSKARASVAVVHDEGHDKGNARLVSVGRVVRGHGIELAQYIHFALQKAIFVGSCAAS